MKYIMAVSLIVLTITNNFHLYRNEGYISAKGKDRIVIEVKRDGEIIIRPTTAVKRYQELYWLQLKGSSEKRYVNLFCYEDNEVGDFIKIGPECDDIRFQTEF